MEGGKSVSLEELEMKDITKRAVLHVKFTRPKEPVSNILYTPQLVLLPSQEVYPLVKGLFSKEISPNLELAWTLAIS